uniref:Putative secreted protein n=1 Tax=Ornithodoros turicata TaxID=34597 RepID=A0A2R5LFU1_9ACAR
MQPADALEDDFEEIYARDEVTWLDKVSMVLGKSKLQERTAVFLTDDDMYRKMGFKNDYDWSTTVVFKFQVGSKDVWFPTFTKYLKQAGIAFGGWSRTNIEYVHLFKAETVNDADELVSRGDVIIDDIPCKLLPLRTVDDLDAV